jgi:hypothetical protein
VQQRHRVTVVPVEQDAAPENQRRQAAVADKVLLQLCDSSSGLSGGMADCMRGSIAISEKSADNSRVDSHVHLLFDDESPPGECCHGEPVWKITTAATGGTTKL